jgi:hypothetical protein
MRTLISKTTIMAAMLGLSMTGASLGASAQSLQLDLNNGRIGIGPDASERERQPYRTEREREGISCGEGRRIVRNNGFRDVRPISCGGRAFTYSAVRRGEPVEVRVSAREGRIVGIERF